MTRTSVKTLAKHWAKAVRSQWRAMFLAFPRRVECVACGWRGRRFLDDDWHRDICCPRCASSVRHRLLFATHRHLEGLSAADVYGGRRVLHVAPEEIVGGLIRPVAAKYLRADFLQEGVDIRLDLTDMHELAEASFDVIIACDVLEHVSDFRRALEEMQRVLTVGGMAVLTVPQEDGLAATREDPSLTTDEQRQEAFGQHDHVRMFGDDFPAELGRYGFDVSVINKDSFPGELVSRYRLAPERSHRPRATNQRRVFFCRKMAGPAA